MNLRKKCMVFVLAILLCALPSCAPAKTETKAKILCTTFAAYDWVRNVLGEENPVFAAELLVSDGSDLHSYQPTVADKIALNESALVVYLGGESDRWVCDMLTETTRVVPTFCLSEVTGVILRQAAALSSEEEHAHVHEEGDGHHHAAFDEHLWLSLSNAALCVSALADAVGCLDPDRAELYRSRAAAYEEKLNIISQSYQDMIAKAPRKEILIADRFPFVYLAEEYGLSYCAAFEGCSTESEASFETVVRLAQQADAWCLSCVLVTESSDESLAKSVSEASAVKNLTILKLNSMQSVSQKQIDQGASYLSIMEQNRTILQRALS